jgi:hypothetical protein
MGSSLKLTYHLLIGISLSRCLTSFQFSPLFSRSPYFSTFYNAYVFLNIKRGKILFDNQTVVHTIIHHLLAAQGRITHSYGNWFFKPDTCSKALSKRLMFRAWSMLCSIKSIISSAYYRIDKPSSVRFGITPFVCPSDLALLIKTASVSTTIINSKGDKGSPCLTSFFVWKFWSTISFTFIPTPPP